jgi:hypothetical protein
MSTFDRVTQNDPARTGIYSLATDMDSWGKDRVRRVKRLTKRHGVVCSSAIYSDGKAG